MPIYIAKNLKILCDMHIGFKSQTGFKKKTNLNDFDKTSVQK